MISADLLELLRCPATLQKLAAADPGLVARLNAGAPPAETFDAALVREDRAIAYPVRDGIPILLVDAAIPLR